MVFDLTSTRLASHHFLHLELTNFSVLNELMFSATLAHNVETFIIGEKASTIYIDSAQKFSKNHILTN